MDRVASALDWVGLQPASDTVLQAAGMPMQLVDLQRATIARSMQL
jgi:hypothetical protein